MSARIEMTGKRYGHWLALDRCAPNSHGQPQVRCLCDCGIERAVVAATLRAGTSNSCGCAKPARIAAARTRHGHSANGQPSAMYVLWQGMLARCAPAAFERQPYHAGKGVKVCERWHSFENFLADMGERPQGMTLDRFPNSSGDYEPGNVRWATWKEQRANQRRAP